MLIQLAALVKRPALFAALKKFALGERGSDEMRMKALMMLSEAEYIEGQVEMWREGSLHPVGLTMQEIYSEPNAELPPEMNDLMLAAPRGDSRRPRRRGGTAARRGTAIAAG